MMEEEHRHEERLHRKKERDLDREKRQEDRRRKKWEEYEKCIEHEVEQSEDLFCQEPEFHHAPAKRHHHRRRHASFEPERSEPFDFDSHEEALSEDYDYEAAFNGNPDHQNAENDLIPRSFEGLLEAAEKQKKAATVPKKPTEETSRQPNNPWLQLYAQDPADAAADNDINFDVDHLHHCFGLRAHAAFPF